MGVLSYEYEVVSSISPTRLFKSYILDCDNLVPKVASATHKNYETIHGDGGPGTIKLITLGEGSPYKFVKHRLDEIDEENLNYKYSVIDCDAMAEEVESISYVVKITAGADGGSVVKTSCTYHTKTEHYSLNEEKIEAGKEKGNAIFHAVEAHLHAHPHEYQ